MIVLGMRSASMLLSEPFFKREEASDSFVYFHRYASPFTDLTIKDWCNSPSSYVFLAHDEGSEIEFVIKMLCDYKDTRYSLETLEKRQRCLLEGLRRNRAFTPNIYFGLAPLQGFDLEKGTIRIGNIMHDPAWSRLDRHTEYVLVMKPQEQETRLDHLLENGETGILPLLTDYVAELHNHHRSSLSAGERTRWGSYDHLIGKLRHNLELLDFLVAQCAAGDELARRAINLKHGVEEIVARGSYAAYFQQRVDEGYVRLCHGDIKSPHIWIESGAIINILDAVDFNPMYNHIDILSDFAMLAADVHARTRNVDLVDDIINRYLLNTHQDNEVARAVLDYYIMEKAIVGTGISILYDGVPELGLAFLDVAEARLPSLRASTIKSYDSVVVGRAR